MKAELVEFYNHAGVIFHLFIFSRALIPPRAWLLPYVPLSRKGSACESAATEAWDRCCLAVQRRYEHHASTPSPARTINPWRGGHRWPRDTSAAHQRRSQSP
uniref:Uncharacterized protein n=1 Tax=Knipowitschia caucasica TaxID=637954 RepID=A0AAV2M5K3_KNICA